MVHRESLALIPVAHPLVFSHTVLTHFFDYSLARTNNVANFAVGADDITSASCEEAHCEVGQFVPCSGATRRRMNITSSISRPGDQQCAIVDVKDWGDLFFGSGVA